MGFAQIQLTQGPDVSRPTLEITVSAKQTVDITVENEDGSVVDLTPYDVSDNGPEVEKACQSKDLPITTGIQFVAAEYQGQTLPSVSITCSITSIPNGVVRVAFTACDFTLPGIYLAELQMIRDGELEQVFKLYVDVQASLAWDVVGPLTIAEVRLWARDSLPEDNFLIDEVEFKDAEVAACIRRAVDIWNTTIPVLGRYTYNYRNFPCRSQWLDLTLALLYGIASRSYLRNHLKYSAAGISVDDKDKFKEYATISKEKTVEFKQWAKEAKLQLNAQQCWGSSNIRFRYGNYVRW